MMRFLDKRIKVICDELKQLIRIRSYKIDTWKYKKGNYIVPKDAQEDSTPWEVFNSEDMHWYGPDEHYWFKTVFVVPKALEGKSIILNVKTQIEECDDGKNPQFLLFLNGIPVQGIDMNHREVLLSKSAKTGEKYELELQSYTGILHHEFNLMVEIIEIDLDIQKLYYDLEVPQSAFGRMKKEDKAYRDLENCLNNAINLLDLRTPYSSEFYATLVQAEAYLKVALYEDMAGYDDVIATCIGHTHIDVAWWWTVEQTREKVGRSFATVLKLMEEFPDYKFMSSQPQLYAFLKERYPDLYAKIKMRVKEGRWEAEGGMWVEADTNITSGESLVRQFIYGKKFFKEEFGVDNKILWLPDVFGYSGALPQIMEKCGIKYFMTTKLAWNQFNKIPNDTFMWEGIDGSKILTHFITTLGVGQDESNFFTTYNGMLHPDAIMGGWNRYQNKGINNDILVAFGYGDGGGGPTREMLEYATRMEKGISTIPKVRQASSEVYFEELEKRVQDHKRLETWVGELYFEYHRGTYTSMARNKRSNRKNEFLLMDLELFAVKALDYNMPYPIEELEKLWKILLLNQFHDILPGTSIEEVYEVTKKEYALLNKEGTKLIQERLEAITKKGTGITVYNTLGFDRNDVICLGDVKAKALEDGEHTIYPVQQTEDGAFVYLTDIPSKGSKTYALNNNEVQSESAFTLEGNVLDTPFYKIAINDEGLFVSIFDKKNHREVIQNGSKGNLMKMYEDKPMNYDNWDIDMYYTEKYWDILDVSKLEWKEFGSVRATLEIERRISHSVIKQKIHFYANSQRIDFETYVDWKEHQTVLKVHFPVEVHTDEATFDIQFGNLTRKTHKNTSWDEARFESCAHKWVDRSEGHYGVSLLNDCKYGHSIEGRNMAITLIKSGIEPYKTADQEEHFFTYSLYPHEGDWRYGSTVHEAYKLNQSVYVVKGGTKGDETRFISVNKKNIMIETIKKSEINDCIIVRLYENENALTEAIIKLDGIKSVKQIFECNLLEENIKEMTFSGNEINIKIKPYEIKTYKLVLA